MKYVQRYDGDEFEIRWKGHKIQCCDCGLVHVLNFRVIKGKLFVHVTMDKRATAASRREKMKCLHLQRQRAQSVAKDSDGPARTNRRAQVAATSRTRKKPQESKQSKTVYAEKC